MTTDIKNHLNRRLFLKGATAMMGASAAVPAFGQEGTTEMETPAQQGTIRNNISSFRFLDWQDYFADTMCHIKIKSENATSTAKATAQ